MWMYTKEKLKDVINILGSPFVGFAVGLYGVIFGGYIYVADGQTVGLVNVIVGTGIILLASLDASVTSIHKKIDSIRPTTSSAVKEEKATDKVTLKDSIITK